ncbi:hypothetical protein [Ancylobacter moscoviensis]|uniref:hypothetical protein n=1 Tax=Ancylobacter moscoviensis TaxID=2597768 RepID=UPI001642EF31|nr:hypothetical protein [Ancylobacter moscoviensis]
MQSGFARNERTAGLNRELAGQDCRNTNRRPVWDVVLVLRSTRCSAQRPPGDAGTAVRANRIVTVANEAERRATPLEANSNGITEGKSDGWRLIYCTGSEGEQLEFVQALGPVKQTFDDALEARRKMVSAAR